MASYMGRLQWAGYSGQVTVAGYCGKLQGHVTGYRGRLQGPGVGIKFCKRRGSGKSRDQEP